MPTVPRIASILAVLLSVGGNSQDLRIGATLPSHVEANGFHTFRIDDDLGGVVVVVASKGSTAISVDDGPPVHSGLDVSFEWALVPNRPTAVVVHSRTPVYGASYEIRRLPYEPATRIDEDPIRLTTTAAAMDLHAPENQEHSIELNRRALRFWPADQLPILRVFTLIRLADQSRIQLRFREALEYWDLALSSAHSAPWRAWVLIQKGSLHEILDQLDTAHELMCDALVLMAESSACALEALQSTSFSRNQWASQAMNFIGLLEHGKGELDIARRWYQAALALTPPWDIARRGTLVNNLGGLEYVVGNYQQARLAFEEAHAIFAEAGDVHDSDMAMGNLASVSMMVGDHDRALQEFIATLQIQQRDGNRSAEVITLHQIGLFYLELGQLQEAESFLRRSLELKQTHELSGAAHSELQLGTVMRKKTNFADALKLHQSALRRFRDLGSRHGELRALAEIAADEIAWGSSLDATDTIEDALAVLEVASDQRIRGVLASMMGVTIRGQGDFPQALRKFEEALHWHRASADLPGEINTLYETAVLYEVWGKVPEAIAVLMDAADAIDRGRLGVSNSMLRASFTGGHIDVYGKRIDLLVAQGEITAAFDVATKHRTRVLLESIYYDTPSEEDQARQRARLLKRELAAKGQARAYLADRWPDGEALHAVDGEIADIVVELDALEARLLSGQIGVVPEVSLDSIRSKLSNEQLVVAHWVGPNGGWSWRLTKSDIQINRLPGELEIAEAVARARKEMRIGRASMTPSLEALGRLLFPPRSLEGVSHLYVIPDGPTGTVPYSALAGSEGRTLISAMQITVVPLATMLVGDSTVSSRRAIVISDPVFGSSDARANSASTVSPFARLPATLRESQAVSSALTRAGYDVVSHTGFEANKNHLVSEDLASFDVLHFATHGVVDHSRPQLSGLVLSLVDDSGAEQTGLLSLGEIYDLELDAGLVVLSACDTAAGARIAGEGPISLARGFIVAGAKRVIATLWPVSDRAALELMTAFYESWTQGDSPAQSLRSAQLRLAESTRWANPRFWGGFVLVGT